MRTYFIYYSSQLKRSGKMIIQYSRKILRLV